MKVKIIKDFKVNNSWIRKDEILKVRFIGKHPLDLSPQVQIIEGGHSGEFIPREYFIKIMEEKTYTEKEWNDMENYYLDMLEKERNKVSTLQTAQNNFLRDFVSVIKQAAIAKQVSEMLNEWLDAKYEGDKKTDLDNFSIELTNFIKSKLV